MKSRDYYPNEDEHDVVLTIRVRKRKIGREYIYGVGEIIEYKCNHSDPL